MQLLSKITTALAALMATAAPALALVLDERASTPSANVISFDVIECTKSTAGGIIDTKETIATENECTALPATVSFESQYTKACPAKKSPVLTVYSEAGCSGTAVVDRALTSDDNTCFEAPLLGGKSALFTCS